MSYNLNPNFRNGVMYADEYEKLKKDKFNEVLNQVNRNEDNNSLLENLPPELLQNIYKYLSLKDLYKLSLICPILRLNVLGFKNNFNICTVISNQKLQNSLKPTILFLANNIETFYNSDASDIFKDTHLNYFKRTYHQNLTQLNLTIDYIDFINGSKLFKNYIYKYIDDSKRYYEMNQYVPLPNINNNILMPNAFDVIFKDMFNEFINDNLEDIIKMRTQYNIDDINKENERKEQEERHRLIQTNPILVTNLTKYEKFKIYLNYVLLVPRALLTGFSPIMIVSDRELMNLARSFSIYPIVMMWGILLKYSVFLTGCYYIYRNIIFDKNYISIWDYNNSPICIFSKSFDIKFFGFVVGLTLLSIEPKTNFIN